MFSGIMTESRGFRQRFDFRQDAGVWPGFVVWTELDTLELVSVAFAFSPLTTALTVPCRYFPYRS
jgi:hypothetical protein